MNQNSPKSETHVSLWGPKIDHVNLALIWCCLKSRIWKNLKSLKTMTLQCSHFRQSGTYLSWLAPHSHAHETLAREKETYSVRMRNPGSNSMHLDEMQEFHRAGQPLVYSSWRNCICLYLYVIGTWSNYNTQDSNLSGTSFPSKFQITIQAQPTPKFKFQPDQVLRI